jgi:hypothetical protein
MVHLVQLLLPVQNENGQAFPRTLYDDLAHRLTEQFGGVTAYTRAPATGLWETGAGRMVRDQVVVYEVMVEELDYAWWAGLREELQVQFAQDELVVRAQHIQRL